MKLDIFKIAGLTMFTSLVLAIFVISTSVNEISSRESELSSMVGEVVVVNSDTLIVIDYSMLTNTLTLSNGINISPEYINKLDNN